jgi:hypothetical protein
MLGIVASIAGTCGTLPDWSSAQAVTRQSVVRRRPLMPSLSSMATHHQIFVAVPRKPKFKVMEIDLPPTGQFSILPDLLHAIIT